MFRILGDPKFQVSLCSIMTLKLDDFDCDYDCPIGWQSDRPIELTIEANIELWFNVKRFTKSSKPTYTDWSRVLFLTRFTFNEPSFGMSVCLSNFMKIGINKGQVDCDMQPRGTRKCPFIFIDIDSKSNKKSIKVFRLFELKFTFVTSNFLSIR